MDYKHWCQFLDDDEFKLWEVETLVRSMDDYDIFHDSFHSFRSFISSSFSWRDTKQGHEYWRIIAHREEF